MTLTWTKNAKIRFEEILDYIEKEFGYAARHDFRTRTKEFTVLLKEFPEMGSIEVREKKIRGFQISRQTRVFYRVKGNRNYHTYFFRYQTRSKEKDKVAYALQHDVYTHAGGHTWDCIDSPLTFK